MCPSILLYQADSKYFLLFHFVSLSSMWFFNGNCKLKYFCVKNRHLEVSSDEECTLKVFEIRCTTSVTQVN